MKMWTAVVLRLVLSTSAVAQTVEVKANPLTDADIELIRQDVQGQKNQIVTDTMNRFDQSPGSEARRKVLPSG